MGQRVSRVHVGKQSRNVEGNKDDGKIWKEVGQKNSAVVITKEDDHAKINIELQPEKPETSNAGEKTEEGEEVFVKEPGINFSVEDIAAGKLLEDATAVTHMDTGQQLNDISAQDSEDDCEEVWCDSVPQVQVDGEKRARFYDSENEEGALPAVMGKEKCYDSDADHITANEKSNMKEDKALRKSQRGGKLWVFWNIPNIFEIVLCTIQSVSGWFKWDAHRVLVTFVYAKCSYVDRRELWHDLEEWTDLDQPWLVLGDFNVIRRDSERVGGNPRPFISMLEFNNCIDRCGLLEVSSSGQRMSWCNGHGGVSRSWAKLDRVLMNNFFANLFPSVHFNYLRRKSSDHCPMVVYSDHPAMSYGPFPFHFLNMWCSHDGFLMCVKETWNQQDTESGLLKLSIHLERTKIALRAWNKNVFGRVDVNIRALEERLDFLDSQLQSGFSKEIEDDFVATKTEIEIWEKREASRLGQIAKKKWLTEGDENSKFFHSVINQRRNKGQISKMVLADGRVLCTAEEVHEEAVAYFRNFLSDVSTVEHCDLSRLIEKKISNEENLWLCAAPSELEVKQAVFSIPKNSSPGPDGFGSGFYMSCWDIIKEDVVAAAGDFFRGVPLSSSVLDVLVSHEQGAFIPGHSIFENITLAQEMVLSLHKKSVGGNVLIKLDMAKAYDRVNWDFLLHVIRAFGFSDIVCQIIANCVQSQWFSVMMNGTFKGFFQSAKGLRQGDPLSPYLFILMEEVLSRLLRSNFQDGRICKFSHPIGAPLVSHLLYADDILIFTNGGKRSINNLLHTLDTYERWSGQKISRDKSALFLSKLISNLRKRSLLSLTGFKEGPLSIRVEEITNNRLRLQDCWSNNFWDEDLLRELVSEEVVEEIIQMPINVTHGPDFFVWKPSTDGRAEMKAILDGIRLCKRLHMVNVIIESDSQIVVDWLCKGKCSVWYLWDFWEVLRKELEGLNFVVVHQLREGNSAADFLAREGEMGLNVTYNATKIFP
ncbi:hypothetical protein F2P56_018646, partial [Juglans regia]